LLFDGVETGKPFAEHPEGELTAGCLHLMYGYRMYECTLTYVCAYVCVRACVRICMCVYRCAEERHNCADGIFLAPPTLPCATEEGRALL